MAKDDAVAAELGHVLGLAVGGQAHYVRSTGSLADVLNQAINVVGSRRALARLLGRPESTLRGWGAGVTPRQDPRRDIVRAARTAGRTEAFQRAWDGSGELAIAAVVRISSDVRDRTIHVGRYIPRRNIQRALTHWLNGDDLKAGRVLLNAIDAYYGPMKFEQPGGPGTPRIQGMWFE